MSQHVTPPYYYESDSRTVRKDIGDKSHPIAYLENWAKDTDPTGDFIVTACNEHAALKADKIALQVQVNRLKIDMDIVRGSLEVADQAMQNAADVHGQLVAALQGLMVKYAAFVKPDADDRRYNAAIEALAAAGVTP